MFTHILHFLDSFTFFTNICVTSLIASHSAGNTNMKRTKQPRIIKNISLPCFYFMSYIEKEVSFFFPSSFLLFHHLSLSFSYSFFSLNKQVIRLYNFKVTECYMRQLHLNETGRKQKQKSNNYEESTVLSDIVLAIGSPSG